MSYPGWTLDRYALISWVKIFVLTSLGFPLIAIVIHLTDHLHIFLQRDLSLVTIAYSYIFAIPENAYLVMPAAVLFATVFTVGAMGRHSEITAAKAGGISFYRLALPLFGASLLASGLALGIGEIAPGASARQLELQAGEEPPSTRFRYNFVFRGDGGWVYTVRSLDLELYKMQHAVFERQGSGIDYPTLAIRADSATYDDSTRSWNLWRGTSRVIAGSDALSAISFERMQLAALTQAPDDLMVKSKEPEEMRYQELGRYIEALRRSGNDVAKLEVQRARKIALPVACLIISLLAAPLAVTSARAGAAMGVAVSLGTTVVYLLLLSIAEAVGASGVMHPIAAAWAPNAMFGVGAMILLARVST